MQNLKGRPGAQSQSLALAALAFGAAECEVRCRESQRKIEKRLFSSRVVKEPSAHVCCLLSAAWAWDPLSKCQISKKTKGTTTLQPAAQTNQLEAYNPEGGCIPAASNHLTSKATLDAEDLLVQNLPNFRTLLVYGIIESDVMNISKPICQGHGVRRCQFESIKGL